VEHFVEALARDLGPGDKAGDRRTRRQLLRLSLWATGEGMALDREVILDPDSVERFIGSIGEERSAGTYRAVLRRVCPLLTTKAPWEPRAKATPRRQLAPPYRAHEILTLVEDAMAQPSATRRRAAHALMVLGLGAGLDGRWVTRVSATDVWCCGPAVVVEVGQLCARSVVCLGAWEAELLGLTRTAAGEFLVGGRSLSKNRTYELTASLVVPTGHPRLAPARLRSALQTMWVFAVALRLALGPARDYVPLVSTVVSC
jgi:hypothetical protein